MLRIDRVATASVRTDIAEAKPKSMLPIYSTLEQSLEGADVWVDIDEVPAAIPSLASPRTMSARSTKSNCIVRADLRYNLPPTEPDRRGTTFVDNSYCLDTATFPSHATYLLPSELNGTRRAHASYALRNPSGMAATFQELLEQYAHELDARSLLHNLKQVAGDCKDDFNDWLNQTFAGYDLVEMHYQARYVVPGLSMPHVRQLDGAVDSMTEIAHSLRTRCPEPEVLEANQSDKYMFALVTYQKARRSLIDQGICKEWQFLDEEHAKLQQNIQSSLLYTFMRVRQIDTNVPLFQAKPQWVADRKNKVWQLELDVGVVGVEIGPVTDVSLVEVGFIDTGFELPESCACVSIADIDRHAQDVEDDWQLLEP